MCLCQPKVELYIVLTILYTGKLEVSAKAFNFCQCTDRFPAVYLTQLKEVEFQPVTEQKSALAVAYLKDIVTACQRWEKSAARDRDDYATFAESADFIASLLSFFGNVYL